MYEHLRTWTTQRDTSTTARLDLWDTGRTRGGKCELRYALAIIPDPASDLSRAVVVFDGEEYYPSPLIGIDSDEAAGALVSFFAHYGESIRYSGDNADVPEDLTAQQRETLAGEYDALAMWAYELEEN